VHSVNFAAKLVHTRRALSSTVINSHQEPVSGQACNPPDPHYFFLSFSWWRSFTVLGTKVAPFPYLMRGVAFTAYVFFLFFFLSHNSSLPTIGRDSTRRWYTPLPELVPADPDVTRLPRVNKKVFCQGTCRDGCKYVSKRKALLGGECSERSGLIPAVRVYIVYRVSYRLSKQISKISIEWKGSHDGSCGPSRVLSFKLQLCGFNAQREDLDKIYCTLSFIRICKWCLLLLQNNYCLVLKLAVP